MYNTANQLLNILNNKSVTYFIGDKVRDDIVHPTNKKKKKYNSISLISSLSQDDLHYLFKNSKKYDDYILINFGLYEFKIYSFRFINDINLSDRQKNNIILESLNYIREKKDFTINILIMDQNEEIIDFNFKYKNHKVSCLNDIKNNLIRIIGNPKNKIKNDPILILKAFNLMSNLNYEIEKNTLAAIDKYKELLQNLDKSIIIEEFNKILKGKNIGKTIKLMFDLGFFELKIEHKYNFFSFIKNNQILKNVMKLNRYNKITLIEIYTVIFKDKYDLIDKNLKTINILNDEDIEKVKWLVKNFNLLEFKNKELRLNIYNNTKNELIFNKKMPILKDLLNKLVNIHLLLGSKIKRNDIMFALCSRPYFYEQLKISDQDICKLYYKKYNDNCKNLNEIKNKILYELIIANKYPNHNLIEFIYNII